MQEVASGPPAPAGGWSLPRGARIASALAGLGGALAIAGALLPWVSVTHGRKSEVLHGTSFSVGTLTLIAGIVLVLCTVVWLAVASMRARIVLAVVVVALSAAVAVAIGAGLGTKSFLNDAVAKSKHHQRNGQAAGSGTSGSNRPASVTGAAYLPNAPAGSSSSAATTILAAARSGGGLVAQADAAKARKNRKVTSTLAAGVFIALAGGVLALVGGLWLLLASSGTRAPAGPSGEPAGSGPPAPTEPPATEAATVSAAPIASQANAAQPDPAPSRPVAPAEAETTQLPPVPAGSVPEVPAAPAEPAAHETAQMNPVVDDDGPIREP